MTGGLYNELFGMNGTALALLSPLVSDELLHKVAGRFRDVFAMDGRVVVYNRVGGANRSYDPNPPHGKLPGYDEDYDFGEDALYGLPTFQETWDDEFDQTYACYALGVPDEWRSDFDNLMSGETAKLSDAYKEKLAGMLGVELGDVESLFGKPTPNLGEALSGEPPDWAGILDEISKRMKE